MDNRLDLHNKLLRCCTNVYFQPPDNKKLTYPCIVYNPQELEDFKANNNMYVGFLGYQVTVIDQNPDSEIPRNILSTISMCSMSNWFVTDNLYHTVLTIYTTL